MSRPSVASVFRTLLLLSVITLAGSVRPDSSSAKPNIIYILADDLGYAELGSYGQERIRTPNLDKIAAEGIRFTQHYSGSPVCAPARGTLLTGRHTGTAYVRDNYELGGYADDEEGGQLPLPEGTITLGHFLQKNGYTTSIIGKWGLGGPGTTGVPNLQGFDHFFGYLCQKQAHNYYPSHLWRNQERVELNNEYFSAHQRFEGDPEDPSAYDKYSGNDYAMDLMTEEALSFISDNSDEPFFLYLAYPVPHVSLQVPESSLDEYKGQFPEEPYLGERSYLPHQTPRAAYAAMITRMDDQIGEILERLEALGLTDNTLIMFSSDNGTTYDVGGVDSEFFNSVGELRDRKGSLYEGGIRVPMIAAWPGTIQPGQTTDHISALWDVFPTVADLLGQQLPTRTDGISFLPTLMKAPEQPKHEYLYWEHHGRFNGSQAVRYGNWKGVRIEAHNNPEAPIALYNLAEDISESNDVSEIYPEIVRKIDDFMSRRTLSQIQQWNFARYNRGSFGRN